MPRQLKPRTRAGKTWTEAKYWQFIRSALRQATMRYPVIQNFKEISVDHIVPAGSLKTYDDLPGFVERLFCEEDNLQILCKDNCHQAKTNKERKK